MEKRLTAQGPKKRQSYTVTLPKEWVQKENLDKTKLINLEIAGNKIILSPTKFTEEKITINSQDYKNSIDKILPHLYKLGIKEIKILIEDEKLIEKIYEVINEKLISYEIIEQKDDCIVIKYITQESEEDFKIILRRIFLLLLELSISTTEIKIKTIDKNINRLYNYAQRILIKKGHVEFLKIPFYYLLLDQLEKISDELKWFLKCQNISKKEYDTFNQIKKILQKAYELFYKFNTNDYNTYQDKCYQIKNRIKLGTAKINISTIHLHNLARLLNSVYGTIFTLKI